MTARTLVVLTLVLACPAALAASPAGSADLTTFLAAPSVLGHGSLALRSAAPERVPALDPRLWEKSRISAVAPSADPLLLGGRYPILDTAKLVVGDGPVRAGLSATRIRTNLEQLLYGFAAPSLAGDPYLYPLLGRDRAPSRIAVRLFFEIQF